MMWGKLRKYLLLLQHFRDNTDTTVLILSNNARNLHLLGPHFTQYAVLPHNIEIVL